jgi:hypothetical protein
VLARVQAKRRHAMSPILWAGLPDDVLRCTIAQAARPHRATERCSLVCWAWCSALRGCHVMSCLGAVTRVATQFMLTRDVWALAQVCKSCARALRKRLARRLAAWLAMLKFFWLGRRVRVPWEADGPGVSYIGTVIAVWSKGRAMRVKLDEPAGPNGMRCHTRARAALVPVDIIRGISG